MSPRKLQRLAATGAILAGLLWGLVQGGMFVAPRAHAQRLTDRQETVVRLYVQTRLCMRSAGDAAHRRRLPERDEPHVRHFMVSVCGDPLRAILQYDGMSDADARMVLVRMSRTSYYEDVLGVAEPKE